MSPHDTTGMNFYVCCVWQDIKELNLTDVPEKRGSHAEKGDSRSDSIIADFTCPVVGIEMSGKHRLV